MGAQRAHLHAHAQAGPALYGQGYTAAYNKLREAAGVCIFTRHTSPRAHLTTHGPPCSGASARVGRWSGMTQASMCLVVPGSSKVGQSWTGYRQGCTKKGSCSMHQRPSLDNSLVPRCHNPDYCVSTVISQVSTSMHSLLFPHPTATR